MKALKRTDRLMQRADGMRSTYEEGKPQEADPLRRLLAIVATIDARPFLGGAR